jgi:Xaa-Pro dipeptidase
MKSAMATAPYHDRVNKLQQAMRDLGFAALVIEPGPAMLQLTGVRWGRSERAFLLVIPRTGEPGWVLPAFEARRAREVIQFGEIRLWQEDESPFAQIVQLLTARAIPSGRLGLENTVRFFIFDGLRREAPGLEYASATEVLKAAGVVGV